MSRLKISFDLFSRQGIKFLVLELIIVFLGVYLAFLFQNYSANKQVETEQTKVLIGLKEDLEYFRLFFPGFSSNAERLVQNWNEVYSSNSYADFSTWRFIQPQYDYSALEYALNADADIIDYELNSIIAEVYQELQKLRHTELLITEIAMSFQAVPTTGSEQGAIAMIEAQNLQKFRMFIDRSVDRHRIISRIAEISNKVIPSINERFDVEELKAIELELIAKQIKLSGITQVDEYLPLLLQYFPNLNEEEIRTALSNPDE